MNPIPASYSEALLELQELTSEMESEAVPVDELAARIRRASDLIRWCRTQLRAAEDEVAAVMEGFEGD